MMMKRYMTTAPLRLSWARADLPNRLRSLPAVRRISHNTYGNAAATESRARAFRPRRQSECAPQRVGCGGVRCCKHRGNPGDFRSRPFQASCFRFQGFSTDSRTGPGEGQGAEAVEPSTNPSVATSDSSDPVSLEIPGSQTGGRKLAIVFTCDVCQTRSAKQFTERSYLHGVVIVRCPGCQNLHLIADRLGYFDDGHWDLNKIAEVRSESIRSVTDNDVFEALDLEDLVGRDKVRELQDQLEHSQSSEEDDATTTAPTK